MTCIFCKIIKGEIPSYKVYEDEYCISILDINPRAKGHTLVIPKKHFERIDDADEEYLSKILLSIKKTVEILMNKLKIEGYNLISNCGKVAGQEINHLHFHILPRFSNDNIKLEYPPVNNELKNKLKEIYEEITK